MMFRPPKVVLWSVAGCAIGALAISHLIAQVPPGAGGTAGGSGTPPTGSGGAYDPEFAPVAVPTSPPTNRQPGTSVGPAAGTPPVPAATGGFNPLSAASADQLTPRLPDGAGDYGNLPPTQPGGDFFSPPTGMPGRSLPPLQIGDAVQKLRDAKSEDEKRAARDELRQRLATYFAQDMQARREQAQAIERRLAKLKEQYEARERVQSDIIDLQLKVLEQEAAGLGFPTRIPGGLPGSGDPGGFGGFPAAGSLDPAAKPGPANAARTTSAPPPIDRPLIPAQDVPSSLVLPEPVLAEPPGTPRANLTISGRRDRPLAELRQSSQALIDELHLRGHILIPRDKPWYAYVNANIPNGPSEVRVVDAESGNLIASARVREVVGHLEITDEGIATREPEGLKLRVSLKTRTTPTGQPVYDPMSALAPTGVPGVPGDLDLWRALQQTVHAKALPVLGGDASTLGEYIQIRQQLEQAREALRRLENQFDPFPEPHVLSEAKETVQQTQRLLDAKLSLLELDRQAAKITLAAIQQKLERLTELYKKNAVSLSEVEETRTAQQAAEVELQRAETLYKLFEAIRESKPADDASTTPAKPEPTDPGVADPLASPPIKP